MCSSTLYLHPPPAVTPNSQLQAYENPQHRAYKNSPDFPQPSSAFVLEPKRLRKTSAENPRERNRKAVTLTSRNFSDLNDHSQLDAVMSLLPIDDHQLVTDDHDHPSNEKCNIKPVESARLPLPTEDLDEGMSDFLCDFENFESIPEIEFSYDDPFKII